MDLANLSLSRSSTSTMSKLARPKFISKKEREKKRKEEESKNSEKKRKLLKKTRQERKDFEREVRDSHTKRKPGNDYSHRKRERRERDGEKSLSKEEQKQIKIEEERKNNKDKINKDIKDTYLGRKKREKRVIPLDHRQRFNFDWEPTEDTSVDPNELYAKKADVSLAFGRGFVAGVDREAQKTRNSAFLEMLRKHKAREPRRMARIIERKEERIRRLKEKRLARKSAHHLWKHKKLEDMTDRDWRIFREDFGISTRGIGKFTPIRYWEESALDKRIKEELRRARYRDPTPVQRMAIPIGLARRDIVGIAETGSGKTCAFVIPMLEYILKLPPLTPQNSADGPYAVILAPSRELAEQIERETERFAKPLGVRTVSIIGGTSFETQASKLRAGAEILIGTPGRLADCLDRKYVVFNQCNYVVLDEADRMIDLGFEAQVVEIFDRMPSSNLQPENTELIDSEKVYRQTTMFSATMPPMIEKLAGKYLRNPVFVAIGDRFGNAAANVRQNVIFASESEKRKLCQEILERTDPPVMIFCNQKRHCDALDKYLHSQGFSCTTLHGGKSQDLRASALRSFREHDVDILICTDVAGRGIDVKGVTHVINFDMPRNIEYYTHRIGRTGRAGAEGEATTFLGNGDEEMFFDLKKLLVQSNNMVPPELANHPASMHAPGAVEQQVQTRYVI